LRGLLVGLVVLVTQLLMTAAHAELTSQAQNMSVSSLPVRVKVVAVLPYPDLG
jgi:hypothetical protein